MQRRQILDNATSQENIDRFSVQVMDVVKPNGNRNYLMSAPSLAIAQKIKVAEEKFDGTMFHGLTEGRKITILINDKLFYRYLILKDSILCIWVTLEPKNIGGIDYPYLTYTTFRINTVTGSLSYPVEEPFKVELFERFAQYLIFLEFSELETRS